MCHKVYLEVCQMLEEWLDEEVVESEEILSEEASD